MRELIFFSVSIQTSIKSLNKLSQIYLVRNYIEPIVYFILFIKVVFSLFLVNCQSMHVHKSS